MKAQRIKDEETGDVYTFKKLSKKYGVSVSIIGNNWYKNGKRKIPDLIKSVYKNKQIDKDKLHEYISINDYSEQCGKNIVTVKKHMKKCGVKIYHYKRLGFIKLDKLNVLEDAIKKQNQNQLKTILVTDYEGNQYTFSELERITGTRGKTIYKRYKEGERDFDKLCLPTPSAERRPFQREETPEQRQILDDFERLTANDKY